MKYECLIRRSEAMRYNRLQWRWRQQQIAKLWTDAVDPMPDRFSVQNRQPYEVLYSVLSFRLRKWKEIENVFLRRRLLDGRFIFTAQRWSISCCHRLNASELRRTFPFLLLFSHRRRAHTQCLCISCPSAFFSHSSSSYGARSIHGASLGTCDTENRLNNPCKKLRGSVWASKSEKRNERRQRVLFVCLRDVSVRLHIHCAAWTIGTMRTTKNIQRTHVL